MLRSIVLGIATGLCCLDMAFANPRVDLVYRPSSKNILYESRAFLPISSTKNSILFADIRGVSDFDTSTEFNLGIGNREYLQDSDAVIGAYYFYDRRQQTERYEQSTIGGEILSKNFEVRANFYFPFKGEYANLSVNQSGSQVQLNGVIKKSMGGKDAEVGFKLPISNKELWVYAGLYKFSANSEGVEATQSIQGKKIRAEFDFANSSPYGVTANISAEYDYNDNKDDRSSTFIFRLGLPFGLKEQKYRQDYRMIKPIVRDVDVRIDTAIINEEAKVKVGSIEFNEIKQVSTESELYAAVNRVDNNQKRLIVVNGNIFAARPLQILSNDMIIAGNEDIEFIGVTSGIARKAAFNQNIRTPKLSYFGNSIDSSKLSKLQSEKTKILYNNVEYDSIEFIKTEAELVAAAEKPNSILVLDNDISVGQAVPVKGNTIIIGKGQVVSKDSNGDTHITSFDNIRKITDISNNNWDYWSYHAGQQKDFIIDGIEFNLSSIIRAGDNKFVFIAKNSTLNNSGATQIIDFYSKITGAKYQGKVQIENTKINQLNKSATANVIQAFWSAIEDHVTQMRNVEINIDVPLDGSNIFYGPNIEISGEFKVRHPTANYVIWDANSAANNQATIFNLAKDTKIIVEYTENPGTVVAEYHVNKDVTIGRRGILSPLNGKKIHDFDLSDTSLTGLQAGDITKVK